jgi:PAS domain S-box-containing protein
MPENRLTFESYESLFKLLYPDTGDVILIVSEDMKILAANEQTGDLFGRLSNDLIGSDCHDLIAPKSRYLMDRAIGEIKDSGNWEGELNCLSEECNPFPVDMSMKLIRSGNVILFCIIIRDLTDYKDLKEQLRHEKANRREMYVTMRNLMKAFDREKSGLERNISHKIETLLLPTLDKIRKETSVELRNTFLEILREQLIVLTKGFGTELDSRFLSLTRTEMNICKLIQSGYSSKEIAENLNLSFETIHTHRKNIRKKLGLRGKKVNLYSMLSSKSFFTDYTS